LGQKAIAIVLVAVFAVVLGILFMTYSGLTAEQRDLDNRLKVAQTREPVLAAERADLQTALAQARSARDEAAGAFPSELHSIEYGEHLFDLMDIANQRLPSLPFPRPSSTSAGPVTYTTAAFALPVSGTPHDLYRFIDIITADDRFASTAFTSITLNVADGSATVNVVIYAYRR